MNILFLTLLDFKSIQDHNIYADLMREFVRNGHKVFIISPVERRQNQKTSLIQEESVQILKLKIGNTQKTNIIEKGISTVTIEPLYISVIKKYFSDVKFDLVLYSTPPITFCNAIEFVKKRDGAKTYLLLKDIFPQNAVDLGMFSKRGLIYRYFRAKEKALYRISDKIGCMSPANVEYLLKHNPEIPHDQVEICPNAIIPHPVQDRTSKKRALREKYGIPDEAIVYLYGGNLGKPQGIPFLVDCLKANMNLPDRYFIICGEGSEYGLLEDFINTCKPGNVKLMRFLPKEEYDLLAAGCDVGLVFLDYRFTIPNFPSRILSYMENEMPILVCTDAATDLGEIAEKNGFGVKCHSNDVGQFGTCMDKLDRSVVQNMGRKAREFLEEHYLAKDCYAVIAGGKD